MSQTATAAREPLLRIAKREGTTMPQKIAVRAIAILLALVVDALFIFFVTGLNPLSVYGVMWSGTFANMTRFSWMLRDLSTLLCVGIALAPAFKMRFWNCGGEGQILIGGLIAALMAYLIGLPVLRLKSDYLAIATLGFAEILRAFFQWNALGPITNGSNLLKGYPDFGHAWAYLILIAIFIGIILLMVNSTYGRAFKAIRDDEVAAEAMGINLAHHKRLAFVISSFFAGVGGGMLAMYMGAVQALSFKSTMTYEILLIVVIGGIGSITGSVITSFLYIASVEWLLRGLDSGEFLGIQAPGLFKNGFRMAIVSVIIMLVVLFFRKGIMGDRELTDLLRRKSRKEGK